MKTKVKVLKTLLIACSLPTLLTGCASYMCGTKQTVPITSYPKGAAVTVYNDYNDVLFEGKTPCNVELRRSVGDGSPAQYKLVFRHEGYAPEEVILAGRLNRAYSVNVANGGIGMVVDSMTGAKWTLAPCEVSAKLTESTTLPSGEIVADTSR